MQQLNNAEEGNEHIEIGPASRQNKKRSSLSGVNSDLEPPSSKRVRFAKDVSSQESKETGSATRVSIRKPRSSSAKSIAKASNTLVWSVVAGPASTQAIPKTRSDARPRLWSSSREELVSAYVEIAGSKCINNISWISTDMPILILDDNFISLEKIKDTPEDELSMDVIFVREFICKAPPAAEDGPSSAQELAIEGQEGVLSITTFPQPLAPPTTNELDTVATRVHEPPFKASGQPSGPSNAYRIMIEGSGNLLGVPAPPQVQVSPTINGLHSAAPTQHPIGPPMGASSQAHYYSNAQGVTMEGQENMLEATTLPQPRTLPTTNALDTAAIVDYSEESSADSPIEYSPQGYVRAFGHATEQLAQNFENIIPIALDISIAVHQESEWEAETHSTFDASVTALISPGASGSMRGKKDGVGDSSLLSTSGATGGSLLDSQLYPVPSAPAPAPSQFNVHASFQPPTLTTPPMPRRVKLQSRRNQPNKLSSGPLPNTGRRSTPITPMSDIDKFVERRTNTQENDNYTHYPNNRTLPDFTNMGRNLGIKHGLPLPVSYHHRPVQPFKIISHDVKDRQMVSGEARTSRVEPPIAVCRCTKMKFIPNCQICNDPASMGEQVSAFLPPPLDGRQIDEEMLVRVEGSVKIEPGEIVDALDRPPPTGLSRGRSNVGGDERVKRRHVVSTSEASIPLSFTGSVSAPIGNTVRRALNSRSTSQTTSNLSHMPQNANGAPLKVTHKPHLVAQNSSYPPLHAMSMPHNQPNTTSRTLVPQITASISPTPKRKGGKGKERVTEVGVSSDEEPLARSAKHMRQPKKVKFDPKALGRANKNHGGTMSVACSSKTRVEDITLTSIPIEGLASRHAGQHVSPSNAPISGNKPTKRRRPQGVAKPPPLPTMLPPPEVLGQGQQSIEPSKSDISQSAQQPGKRHRGRPRKAANPPSQLPSQSVHLKAEPEAPSIPSASTPLSTKPKPRSKPTKSATTLTTPLERSTNGVPTPIPDELQALVGAYLNSNPVGVFATEKQVKEFWGLNLARKDEIRYSFMGFYRVSRVWESVVESGGSNAVVCGKGRAAAGSDGITKARVQWRFRMKWEPGGEDWQAIERDKLLSPWWNTSLRAQGLSTMPQPELEDSDKESTDTYRNAREHNPNFARRHCFFGQTFFSVLPLHLLAPIEAQPPDSSLPRGWHCQDCGKLNFRCYLRHRRCGSSYCQDKPEAEGYAIGIDRMRDPQDNLPLTLPLNELTGSGHLKPKVQAWNDRMKTLVYGFEPGNNGRPIVVQHVFTCNSRTIQEEPSELLSLVQVYVPLRRLPGDMNPFFMHFVQDGQKLDDTHSSWTSAPECLRQARELMHRQARKYARKSDKEVKISKLELRAWVTAGSRRTSDLLCAKQRCMVIMCLGCEVILSINPKSSIASNDNQARIPDLDKLIPMDSFDLQEDQLHIQLGEAVKVETDIVPGETEKQNLSFTAAVTRAGARNKTQNLEKTTLSMSLIHGDIVVLEGDDFEYSIKRTGTSIVHWLLNMRHVIPSALANAEHIEEGPNSDTHGRRRN